MLTRLAYSARPPLAGLLVLSLLLAPGAAVPAAAQEGRAGLHGTIYLSDGDTELAGVKVMAINVKTGKQYISEPTDKGGDYEIDGLPEGTYDVVIETPDGIFVTDNLVDLGHSEDLSVSYAIQPMRPANRRIPGLKTPKGSATPVGAFRGTGDAAGELSGGGRAFWKSPGGIVLISVLAVGAALAVHNHGDSNASPSAP